MALVVTSKVKALIKTQKMNMAGDLGAGLDKKVSDIVQTACERAKANGRKTVRTADL